MTSTDGFTTPVPACRGVDPELFFGPSDSPEDGPTAAWELTALAVCQRCPLVEACRETALEFGASEQHGVIGGMTAGQRRQVLRLTRQQPTRSYLAGVAGVPAGRSPASVATRAAKHGTTPGSSTRRAAPTRNGAAA